MRRSASNLGVNSSLLRPPSSTSLRRAPSSPQLRRTGRSQALPAVGSPIAASRHNTGARSSASTDAADATHATDAPAATEVELREVCSICLETLTDAPCWEFPCGFSHRLHYPCALLFLSSSISALQESVEPVSPGSRRYVTEGLGQSLRAIDSIGAAFKNVSADKLQKIACPLCRRSWPSDDAVSIDSIMSHLCLLQAQTLHGPAEKMLQALSRARDHFEHGADAGRARMTRGLLDLDGNQHSATTFFLSRCANQPLMSKILGCLRCAGIQRLSAVSKTFSGICYNDVKLRVPCVSVSRFRTAMHHVSAPDLKTLEVVADIKNPSMTAFDMLTCTKWLSTCSGMNELAVSGMKWEQIDPGGQHLGKSLVGKDLRVLDLSNNYLIDTSLACLASSLKQADTKRQTLQVFNVNINCITDVGLEAVLPLGSCEEGIKEWGFRHNQLGNNGCEAISKALWKKHVGCHVSGTSWDLRTNKINAEGLRSLLPVFECMTVARLGCNPIGDNGAKLLAPSISETLVVLDLGQAKIGDDGASALSKKLVNATSLRDLILAGNEIGPAGASCLADGWAWVGSLRFIDMSCNPLGVCGIQGISQEIQFWTQKPLRLSLAAVDCDDHGAQYLVSALQRNNRRGWGWKIELGNNTCSRIHSHVLEQLLADEVTVELGDDADLLSA